ncbi:hypothetical protein GEMRC1_005310 [Eukaryota sp. GEM-RC1]
MNSCPHCLQLSEQLNIALLEKEEALQELDRIRIQGQKLYSAYESKVKATQELQQQLNDSYEHIESVTEELNTLHLDYRALNTDCDQHVLSFNALLEDYEESTNELDNLRRYHETVSLSHADHYSSLLNNPQQPPIPISEPYVTHKLHEMTSRISRLRSLVHGGISSISSSTSSPTSAISQALQTSTDSSSTSLSPIHEIEAEICVLNMVSQIQTAAELGYLQKLDQYRLLMNSEKSRRIQTKRMVTHLNEKLLLESRRVMYLMEKLKKFEELSDFNQQENSLSVRELVTSHESEVSRLKEMISLVENECWTLKNVR